MALLGSNEAHSSAFSNKPVNKDSVAVIRRGHVLMDPWESYNRRNYRSSCKVNDAVRPLTLFYVKKLPSFVPLVVNNFFENINDVRTAVNELLQARLGKFFSDFTRVILNTLFGVFGLGDAAGVLGWSKNYQDFGLTLARWGFPPGAYLFLPFMGPATVRSGVGSLVDQIWDPLLYFPGRFFLLFLWGVNDLANLVSVESLVRSSIIDKYTFIRSAYWQRRVYLMTDGDFYKNVLSQVELAEIMKDPLE
ncbi:MlaA family lipoprotein [Candidatus Ichthyocystis hellenicum]|uniref:MlaA family lipoprotein n=1 Tax=Candidatus Ichthyocystis hellenicum TaxID=1561003 RepID=UPI001585D1FA|nr:VacJ family lipoprotein [Candidatus Ichthyocystis hellenicum]